MWSSPGPPWNTISGSPSPSSTIQRRVSSTSTWRPVTKRILGAGTAAHSAIVAAPNGPPRRPAQPLRLRGLPPRAGRGDRRRACRSRRARGHADRLGQVALLPAAGAHARRPHDRRLAAGLADAGPGRGARGARRRGARRSSTPSRTRPPTAAVAGARRGRRAVAALRRARALRLARLRRRARAGARSACSWSTRRTASRSGATTSGPTTSGSPTPRGISGRARSSPRPRRPRRTSRPTSCGACACATR